MKDKNNSKEAKTKDNILKYFKIRRREDVDDHEDDMDYPEM